MTTKTSSERTASIGTMFMGTLYLGLMLFCMWAAGGERGNDTNTCQRLSNGCSKSVARL
jgi:hypothetical protein